jgi:hypothetical protein
MIPRPKVPTECLTIHFIVNSAPEHIRVGNFDIRRKNTTIRHINYVEGYFFTYFPIVEPEHPCELSQKYAFYFSSHLQVLLL